jgi:uncharacterized protein YlxP (DUF503 family)
VAAGFVGILSAELHFPASRSLKEKRHFLRSAKQRLQNMGAAVAEVDHHDTWQRSRLTLAIVTRDYRDAEQLLDEAERFLGSQEWELGRVERDVVNPDE